MKKRICGAALALWTAFAVLTPGRAADYELAGALGLETTGVFRGVKSTRLNPSVYGYVELARGEMLIGVLANPVSIAGESNALVLGYGEWRPTFRGVGFEFGGQFYAFPDSSDFTYDLDRDGDVDHSGRKGLFEAKAGVEKKFDSGRVRLRAYYTPNGFAQTGSAWYAYGEGRLDLPLGFEARASGGASLIHDARYNNDYFDYNAGLYRRVRGLDLFVRYSDTAGLPGADNRVVVFGIEKAWTLASSARDERGRYRKILNDWSIDKSRLRLAR